MQKKFLATDVIPAAGKYQCVVCWLVVEITQHMIDVGATFFSCPICHAGKEGNEVWPETEFWAQL